MHLYPTNRVSSLWPIFRFLAAVSVVAVLFFYGLSYVSVTSEQGQKATVERAIQKSLTNCYAIEGIYPSSLAYLEEHYGLAVNHEKYAVDYQLIGSNIRPAVTVVLRGGVYVE